MRSLISLSAIVMLIPALLFLYCTEDNIDNGESPTTPKDTLTLFVEAHNHHDHIDAYDKLEMTIAEGFTFYFDPKDVGKEVPGTGYIIPTSWERGEFLNACRHMFNNVYSIALNIPGIENMPDEYTGDEYIYDDCNISLLVMVSSNFGYLANGPVDIHFRKGDDDKWRIWVIKDKTAAGILTESASYGTILAQFH